MLCFLRQLRCSVLDNFSSSNFQKVFRFGKSDSVAKVQNISEIHILFDKKK